MKAHPPITLPSYRGCPVRVYGSHYTGWIGSHRLQAPYYHLLCQRIDEYLKEHPRENVQTP